MACIVLDNLCCDLLRSDCNDGHKGYVPFVGLDLWGEHHHYLVDLGVYRCAIFQTSRYHRDVCALAVDVQSLKADAYIREKQDEQVENLNAAPWKNLRKLVGTEVISTPIPGGILQIGQIEALSTCFNKKEGCLILGQALHKQHCQTAYVLRTRRAISSYKRVCSPDCMVLRGTVLAGKCSSFPPLGACKVSQMAEEDAKKIVEQ